MIVIDMDMPKSCATCKIMCKHKEKAGIRYSRGDFSIPNDCPIKCNIEDIKHDIENQLFVGRLINHYEFDEGLKWCLEIIDKHIKEISDADTHIDA